MDSNRSIVSEKIQEKLNKMEEEKEENAGRIFELESKLKAKEKEITDLKKKKSKVSRRRAQNSTTDAMTWSNMAAATICGYLGSLRQRRNTRIKLWSTWQRNWVFVCWPLILTDLIGQESLNRDRTKLTTLHILEQVKTKKDHPGQFLSNLPATNRDMTWSPQGGVWRSRASV